MGLISMVAQYTSDYYYTTTPTATTSTMSSGAVLIMGLFYLALVVFMITALWKVYVKTGRPGWAAIVPVYNTWVMFEIVGYPGWWALLCFIPLVNIFPMIMMIISSYKLAKLFGKSDGFAVCNVLFSFVTLPILGFGSAQFQGNTAQSQIAAAYPMAPQAPQAPQTPVLVTPVGQSTQAPQGPQQPPVPPQPPVTPIQ